MASRRPLTWTLASDTIKPGMSGAAVLNLRSGGVCGVVVASKHPAHPDGALAIPWAAIDTDLANVLAANRRFHLQDRRWEAAATEPTVDTVRQYDPFDWKCIMRCCRPAPSPADGPDSLTPYLKRDHDNELNAALHRAAAGGPSVFAVLAGGSCTGKTRALYQGLREVVPNWPLLRPFGADELLSCSRRAGSGPGRCCGSTKLSATCMAPPASGLPACCELRSRIPMAPWP